MVEVRVQIKQACSHFSSCSRNILYKSLLLLIVENFLLRLIYTPFVNSYCMWCIWLLTFDWSTLFKFSYLCFRLIIISVQYHQVLVKDKVQSVSWILAEFYFNTGLQRLYTGTCIILQKTINGFLCLLIVFLKSKTYQLILKDVIKLNRNLR